ncbi:MAG: ATP-binding protein [Erysipelotrichaceae bacterium]
MEKVSITFELNEQQKSQRRALIVEVLRDSRIKALLLANHMSENIVSDKVQFFADYLATLDLCKGCTGLEMCRQNETGYVLDIEFNPLLQNVLKPCAFYIEDLLAKAHSHQYLLRDGGDALLLADVSALLLTKYDNTYPICVKTMLTWLDHPSPKGFYLCGPGGVGKTYLAAAVCNYFAKKGFTVALVHIPSLSLNLKANMHDDDYVDDMMSKMKRAKFLVLDDIGAESLSSWFRDEILLPLLNYRMEHAKMTWFTSNLKLDDLKEHLRFNQKGQDDELKANRLMERIKSLSAPLIVSGHNRRLD